MAVKSGYVSKLGRGYKLSPHFTAGEWQSKDGADKFLYSEELLVLLEAAREYLGGDAAKVTVTLNSAYRTAEHNKKVGGATNSTHTKGYAVDAVFRRGGKVIPADLMCCLCQTLGFNGVAYISSSALHLDEYGRTYRGDERKGYGGNVGGDFYEYFGITKAQVAALKYEAPVEEESEEIEMTKQEVKSIVYEVLAEVMGKKALEEPSEWSAEARKWAKDAEIIKGTNIGDEWKSPVDREQFATVLYRLMQKVDPIK